MTDSAESFPVGETLDGGRYEIEGHLFGRAEDRVCTARSDGSTGTRFLVSMTDRAVPSAAELAAALDRDMPGMFAQVFVGKLDERPGKSMLSDLREDQTAIVERLPAGDSVRRLISGSVPLREATQLALGTARILLAAAKAGHILAGVRPETIWAERTNIGTHVTGLSRRGVQLFRAARRGCFRSLPPFERAYVAPEDVSGKPQSDRTPTFIVGLLAVEWITGSHPFPDAGYESDALSIALGRHAPLVLPSAAAGSLRRALDVDPARRQSLEDLIAELEAILQVS
jgi:hypothetical protein